MFYVIALLILFLQKPYEQLRMGKDSQFGIGLLNYFANACLGFLSFCESYQWNQISLFRCIKDFHSSAVYSKYFWCIVSEKHMYYCFLQSLSTMECVIDM